MQLRTIHPFVLRATLAAALAIPVLGVQSSTPAEADVTCTPATEPQPSGPPDPTSPCDENSTPGSTDYVPVPLHLATARPYLPMTDYLGRPASDPTVVAFTDYVDRAITGDPDWGYTPLDALTMYARTGQPRYLTAAIAEEDSEVVAANQAIAAGQAPDIASDDYLDIGPDLEALAYIYDWGYDQLTPAQRASWKTYGDQALANLWSPQLATWGNSPTGTFAWDAWSINNPGNNYNYSFIQATETWALATQETAWMTFLQTYKFPLITNYYEQLNGGGSREGTGYGTAQRRLWANERLWREATDESLPAVEAHAKASIDYWIHATVPTLNLFAPIGDLSRESLPEIYDYQTNLVREAAMSAPGTPEAGRALWWIANNSEHDQMISTFNLRDALLQPSGVAQAPTAPTYAAPGVGEYFARSGWGTGATWLNVTAGPYDESHAHQDQGGFTLYRGTWQAVTPNIWSHSGLQGNGNYGDIGSAASNIIRFNTSSGVIPQNNGTAIATMSTSGATTTVHADLTPVYSDHAAKVKSWTRDLTFSANTLTIDDKCSVATGVTPTWQLQVPTKPTVNTLLGTMTAGPLSARFPAGWKARIVNLKATNSDFTAGFRVEFTHSGSCAFHVVLTAGATALR